MRTPAADSVIRALSIKGSVTPALLAAAVLTDEATVDKVLDGLIAAGLVVRKGAMVRLTDAGMARGAALVAADQETWGTAAATRALESFLALDARTKEVVTAWQLHAVSGQQVVNDHTDAAYDAAVLADLAALHGDVGLWLTPLREGLPRLADYWQRLDHAATRVAAGEQPYIASPRLDSYHGVWFELHEDLIRLAGRTRHGEVAAGRA